MNDNMPGTMIAGEGDAHTQVGKCCSAALDKALCVNVTDDLELVWTGVVHKNDDCSVRDFANEDYFMLMVVNTGTLRLLIGSDSIEVSEGQTVLTWPNEKCQAMEPVGSHLMYQWLRFKVHRSRSQRCKEVIQVPRLANICNPGRASELLRLIGEEFHSCRHFQQKSEFPRSDQPSRFLLMSLLSRIGLTEPEHLLAPNALVALAERGKDYIRSNRHKLINTTDVANALGCSARYLRRAFHHAHGYSPSTFLLHTRLFEARRLLVETHLSITEVSRECGFGSLNYFTRAFRNFHGITPSEYRVAHSHRYVAPNF